MFKPLGGGRGILSFNGKEITTPNFIVPTIRGAIPHLTPDNYPKIPVSAIFTEHFVDQHGFASEAAKILPVNAEFNLVALRPPNSSLLQKPNTDDAVGVSTFQGTQLLNVDAISTAIGTMGASIVISPRDIPNKPGVPGKNRYRKMEKRGESWFKKFKANLSRDTIVIAAVLPEMVNEEYLKEADGVAVATDGMVDSQSGKLRICDERVSLKDVPSLIGKFDLFYTDFDEYTEKGHALIDAGSSIDLHDACYADDMEVLGDTGYARAYVHHLLNAREMTANLILQKHNLSIVSKFFASL